MKKLYISFMLIFSIFSEALQAKTSNFFSDSAVKIGYKLLRKRIMREGITTGAVYGLSKFAIQAVEWMHGINSNKSLTHDFMGKNCLKATSTLPGFGYELFEEMDNWTRNDVFNATIATWAGHIGAWAIIAHINALEQKNNNRNQPQNRAARR